MAMSNRQAVRIDLLFMLFVVIAGVDVWFV
jgi:hypothetical protein